MAFCYSGPSELRHIVSSNTDSTAYALLCAIVNGIVFLISFLDCSLLVYRNTTDFCVLILYLETLLIGLLTLTFFCEFFVILHV